MTHRWCWLITLSLLTGAARADWQVSGNTHLLLNNTTYQTDDTAAQAVGQTSFYDGNLSGRLNAKYTRDAWGAEVHYQLSGDTGDSLQIPGSPLAGGALLTDTKRYFDLTQTLRDDSSGRWVQRLDRLNLGYTTERWVWRLGRQAVGWGNGLVFQPMDIFNPFSPLSINTEYKTGDDMVYGQWLLESGDDLQFLYLPRRDATTGLLDAGQDSTAIKLHLEAGGGGWDLLLARHYSEDVAAIGQVRSVGGAAWRLDLNVTRLTDGREAVTAMTNLDYSWSWLAHNYYGFIEYYYNGLGAKRVDLADIDPALTARLSRGEAYSLGRDELALGLMLELSPRWRLNATHLHNLHDGSGVWACSGLYDWLQNTKLSLGAQFSASGRDTEYGGLYDSTVSGYRGSGNRAYLYIQQYY